MTNLICQFCFCLAIAMQNGGNCHKCQTGSQEDLIKAVKQVTDSAEFMALQCYEKGKNPPVDFLTKQGAIIP